MGQNPGKFSYVTFSCFLLMVPQMMLIFLALLPDNNVQVLPIQRTSTDSWQSEFLLGLSHIKLICQPCDWPQSLAL